MASVSEIGNTGLNERCPRCAATSASIWAGHVLDTWLACDVCDNWFHTACVGLRPQECDQIEYFHCPDCQITHGPSTYKKEIRKSQREREPINYRDLVNADIVMPRDRIAELQNYKYMPDNFERLPGDQATLEWAKKNGLREPVIFTGSMMLGMRMPPSNLTIHDIADLVGRDTPVDVMDVNSQGGLDGWTMDNWEAYFSSTGPRARILNVISLEISGTKLAEQVERPTLVQQLDWTTLHWPEERRRKGEYPKVQLYCLMGVKDAYTDFHIDFGGSSVFYHILSGAKTFFFVPPTPTNLKKYERWCTSPEQASTFFAEQVHPCYRVDLKAGDTMIIPTGWIHAVHTPVDTIVIGGNFIHGLNIARQLDVYALERRTGVPRKFRFPYFEQVCWYAVVHYTRLLQNNPSAISGAEALGLQRLATFIRETREERKRDLIPPDIDDPDARIATFQQLLDQIMPPKHQTASSERSNSDSGSQSTTGLKLKLKLGSKPLVVVKEVTPPPATTTTTPAPVVTSVPGQGGVNKLRIRLSGIKPSTSQTSDSQSTTRKRRKVVFDSGDEDEDEDMDAELIYKDDSADEDFDPHAGEEQLEYAYRPSSSSSSRKRTRRQSHVNVQAEDDQDTDYDPFDILGFSDDIDSSSNLKHSPRRRRNSQSSGRQSRSAGTQKTDSRSNKGNSGKRGNNSVVSRIIRDMRRRM